ncbi:MAG TPA: hypothetical protein VNQ80_06765 [Parapedobacter sp.]|uniref:hypothetical protein n=1 Tax=Parapedobacter sp. TaxID=1958893 RepID=UPI002D054F01|nr:hypothetical protein [Parapedobacter sp.]HWK57018.1 hypothetical protein [Parapedobacter sp.]
MKAILTIGYVSIASFLTLGSCSKANLKNSDAGADFGLLAGTWVDAESYALQFIEFQSTDRGRFGVLSRQSEEYSPFHYTLADSLLTIRFDGHDDFPQSTHKLYSRGEDTLTISDLTVIPENPDKVYVRQRLVTERKGDTIVIGLGDTYYDAEHDFRIRVDSLLGDSRCPEGVQCVWAGNAGVRFEIIAEGNYRHLFDLNTHGGPKFPQDTVINDIRFRLIDVAPYPKHNAPVDPEAKVVIKLFATTDN